MWAQQIIVHNCELKLSLSMFYQKSDHNCEDSNMLKRKNAEIRQKRTNFNRLFAVYSIQNNENEVCFTKMLHAITWANHKTGFFEPIRKIQQFLSPEGLYFHFIILPPWNKDLNPHWVFWDFNVIEMLVHNCELLNFIM